MRKFFLALIITMIFKPSQPLATDYAKSWAREDIDYCLEEEYIELDSQGNFRPDSKITRAEFVRIINRSFNIEKTGLGFKFKDLEEGSDYYEDIARAYDFGYIKGYEDGTFRPNQGIKRAEASKIIGEILGIKEFYNRDLDFLDKESIGTWAQPKIAFLVEKEIIVGYPDGNFKPDKLMTRAEAISVLRRANNLSSQRQGLEIRSVSEDAYFLKARVKVYDDNSELVREEVTDEFGKLSLDLEVGNYLILVESLDKSSYNLEKIRIRKGLTSYIDLVLRRKFLT